MIRGFINLTAVLMWANVNASGPFWTVCCGCAYEVEPAGDGYWTAHRKYPF